MSDRAVTIPITAERIEWAKDEIAAWASSTEQEFCVSREESAGLYARCDEVLAVIDTLVAENRQLRETLVTVALPLEVLRGQIVSKAYTELSPELQSVIVSAVDTIRAALAPTKPDHHD